MPKRRRKTREWRKKGREVEEEAMKVISRRGHADAMKRVADDQLFQIDVKGSSTKRSEPVFDEKDLKMKKRKKTPRVEKTEKSTEQMFDLWGTSSSKKKGLPLTNRDRMKRRNKIVIQNQPKISPVVVPKTGVSYNPSKEAHEDAIAEAAAKEISRYARLESEKMPKVNRYVGQSEEEEEDEEEEDDDSVVKNKEDIAETASTTTSKGKMTRTQRNRQARNRQAQLEILRRKNQKALKHEINMAKKISKDIEKEEKRQEEARNTRDELRKEALINPNKRQIYVGGKKRLHEPMADIALSDELHGSVRMMKPQGNLLKDRWYSMLERNKFELGDASVIRKMKKQQKKAHRAYGKANWGVDHLKRESAKRRT
jgi:nucleolar protein 53